MMRIAVSAFIFALYGAAETATAQVRPAGADSALIARIGKSRALAKSHTREEVRARDALADSLVLIALAYVRAPGETGQAASVASGAVMLLGDAATARPGADPYLGSTPRLVQIARSARSNDVRKSAMSYLTFTADTAAAVRALAQLALESEDGYFAVRMLGQRGAPGIAELRTLYFNGAPLPTSRAREELAAIAETLGWKR